MPTDPLSTDPVAEPDPPTLTGVGGKVVDPSFGATIMQVTETESVTGAIHSYANRSPFNYDNTRILFYDPGNPASPSPRPFKVRAFDPDAFELGSEVSDLEGYYLDPMIWDWSGSRNNILYGGWVTSPEQYRSFLEIDVETYVSDGDEVVLRNFAPELQLAGVVASGSSTTVFTHTVGNPTSPITDFTTHWFTLQKVKFTSGVANGQERIITAYNAGTRQITVGTAWAGTPSDGDTFYIRPAGYNQHFTASPNGRWLVMGVSEKDFGTDAVSSPAGSDTGHTLVAYDRNTDTIYVRRFSKADFSGVEDGGVHRLCFDKTASSTRVWININYSFQTACLWDIVAGTAIPGAFNLGHEDATHDAGKGLIGGSFQTVTVLPGDFAGTHPPVFITPLKSGSQLWGTSAHVGGDAVGKALLSTYIWNGTWPGGWVSDTAPIYRYDGYLLLDNDAIHPTPINLGECRFRRQRLTYMGTAKTDITAAGQWAYNPAGSGGNGQIWVWAPGDVDLSLGFVSTEFLDVFDWRWGGNEIWFADITNPAVTDSFFRICKTYSWQGPGPSVISGSPRAAVSRDGRYVAFTSSWGAREKVDVFIAQVPQDEEPTLGRIILTRP